MLLDLRKKKRFTQTFIAEKLGISRDRLARIESGKVDLPARFIPILAETYEVDEREIINICMEGYNDRKGFNNYITRNKR